MSRLRLVLALTTSGVLLEAAAAGPWSIWFASLFWAVPLLAAMRSFPLALGVPVALLIGTVGRVLAWHAVLGDDVVLASFLAACAAAAAALVDRFVTTWLPRAGIFAWPCALTAIARALAACPGETCNDAARTLAPVPDVYAFTFVRGDAGVAGAVFATALVAQGLAVIAATHNRQVPDPYTQEDREKGTRLGSILGFWVAAALFAVGGVRLALGGAPYLDWSAGDAVAIASALGVVVLLAAAVKRMRA